MLILRQSEQVSERVRIDVWEIEQHSLLRVLHSQLVVATTNRGRATYSMSFSEFLTLSNQMAHNATFSVHKRNKSVKDEALEAKSVSLLCCNLLKQIPEKPKNTYLRLKEVFKKIFLN